MASMPKELKAKWIEALRSGKYKQTIGTLCDERGHCCLGVLMEVAGEQIQRRSDNPANSYHTTPSLDFYTRHNIDCGNNRDFKIDHRCMLLAGYNDSGHSFKQIADIIDQHVKGV